MNKVCKYLNVPLDITRRSLKMGMHDKGQYRG